MDPQQLFHMFSAFLQQNPQLAQPAPAASAASSSGLQGDTGAEEKTQTPNPFPTQPHSSTDQHHSAATSTEEHVNANTNLQDDTPAVSISAAGGCATSSKPPVHSAAEYLSTGRKTNLARQKFRVSFSTLH